MVNFIVRSVDEALQAEFGLIDGLANISEVAVQSQKGAQQVHRVQILNPAAGTGTFLAEAIKRDMPIMCVIGNPPYLGEGGKSEGWIGRLMDDYKKEPGGKEKLQERNPKWLNDLYVKFIRMASHLIDKNGEGVLHSPAYREAYAEFLRTDFPRIPWPKTPDDFWSVAATGAALRKLHLMDPAAIGEAPYPFIGDGDARVERPRFAEGQVWVNKTQRFDQVPEAAWTLFIGGYQPAQKWLKDRKGRQLAYADIQRYQRIIKILAETHRLTQQTTR